MKATIKFETLGKFASALSAIFFLSASASPNDGPKKPIAQKVPNVVSQLEPSLVPGPNQPSADQISVWKRTQFNSITGQETWSPIQNETEGIELGLRVRFQALALTNAAYLIFWHFDDSQFGSSLAAPLHGFAQEGAHEVTLTTYNTQGQVLAQRAITVHVNRGMELISVMDLPNSNCETEEIGFRLSAAADSRVWSIGGYGHLLTGDLSDPLHPQPMQCLTGDMGNTGPFVGAWTMDVSAGNLYIADYITGVSIYNADPNNFVQLASPSQFVCQGRNVVATGAHIFIGSPAGNICSYDVSNPTNPILLDSIFLPAGVKGMNRIGTERLLVYNNGSTANLIDIRNPENLLNTQVIFLASPALEGAGVSYGNRVVLQLLSGGSPVLELRNNGESFSMVQIANLPQGLFAQPGFAFNEGRIFRHWSFSDFEKYDFLKPSSMYLMEETVPPGGDSVGTVFLYDNDGPNGPAPELLYVSRNQIGFAIYKP